MYKLMTVFLFLLPTSCSKENLAINVSSSAHLIDSPQTYNSALSGEKVSIIGMIRFTLSSNQDLYRLAKKENLNLWVKTYICSNKHTVINWSTIFKNPDRQHEFFVFARYESSDAEHPYSIDDLQEKICFLVGMGNMIPTNNVQSNVFQYQMNRQELDLLRAYKAKGGETLIKSSMFDISNKSK